MTGSPGWITEVREGAALTLRLAGDWTISNARDIDRSLGAIGVAATGAVVLDAAAIGRLDTAGAWLIERTRRAQVAAGREVAIANAGPAHAILLERLAATAQEPAADPVRHGTLSEIAERTGRAAVEACEEARDLLNFLGLVTVTAGRTALRPARLRLTSAISHIESVGLNALPIVGLLSFLIGVVLAYQGADQLRRFGAEIFTVNLLGISILREMGILLTAIIVAGRSGSAFTAQIGTMQVNEEIDAMRTIGLDPVEVLVLPRVIALVVALPLLTVYADFMGLAGGALMSVAVLDMSFAQFSSRLNEVVPLSAFWVGLIKAPVFGFVIALVGAREGLKVRGSAESVGRQTTRSVVISIFLVIVLDAVFSIFFSTIGF